MHVSRITSFLLFAGTAFGGNAYAVDPFTVLAAGSAAVSLVESVGGTGKGIGEVRELFSAAGELGDEIMPDNGNADQYRIARKIQAIETAALEAGYTKDEVDEIMEGYRSSNQNLTQSIRLLSRSIRLGKRVANLAGVVALTAGPKGLSNTAGHASAVASVQGQNQEKKLLADIYSQMLQDGLDSKQKEIEKQRSDQEQYKKLRKYVFSIAPKGNVGLFPVDSSLINRAIEVYKAYYWVLLTLVTSIFFCRIVYYQFSFAPAEKYGDLVRDVFVCYMLMIAFPHVYTYMADCSTALAQKLGEMLHVTGAVIPEKIPFDKTGISWFLRPEALRLIIYAAVHTVFNLALSIMIALGPIVILAGTMMNFSVSITAYFVLLLFIWLWPVFWNVLGYFANLLHGSGGLSLEGIGAYISSVITFFAQLFSPAAIYMLVKRTAGGQVVSKVGNGAVNHVRSYLDSEKKNGSKQESNNRASSRGMAKSGGPLVNHTAEDTKRAEERGRVGIQIGKERFVT